MSQDQTELLEQTLAEMEAQQLATQQLLGDTLNELEILYTELSEQAQSIADAPNDSLVDGSETGAAGDNGADVHEALQKTLEDTRRERDHLELQLKQMQAERKSALLERDASQEARTTDGLTGPIDTSTSAPEQNLHKQRTIAVPGASAIRSPFERLRTQRKLDGSVPPSSIQDAGSEAAEATPDDHAAASLLMEPSSTTLQDPGDGSAFDGLEDDAE